MTYTEPAGAFGFSDHLFADAKLVEQFDSYEAFLPDSFLFGIHVWILWLIEWVFTLTLSPENSIDQCAVICAHVDTVLEIHIDQLIRDGVIKDQAEAAKLSRVTRARMSQILSLTNLAPDIQEEILCLPPTRKVRDPVKELSLRPLVVIPSWREQRRRWGRKELN